MDADVGLALGHVPEEVRPAASALWALDAALGKVLVAGSEPMIGRIRLAWWREALERLDREPAPAEPVLQGVATHLNPAGLSGATLAGMEAGWSAMLEREPVTPDDLDTYAAARGGLMFRFMADLLGQSDFRVEAAGEAWALMDLARHSSERHDIDAALAAARGRALPTHWPRRLRPIGMLAVLTARDLSRGPEIWEEPGAPPRVARMLRHRLTGW